MATSKTLAIEVVSDTEKEIVFKLRQEYRPKLMPAACWKGSQQSGKLDVRECGWRRESSVSQGYVE